MFAGRLAKLRVLALVFLLPGLAGLIGSSMVSVHYLDSMPRRPSPTELRTVARNIHGTVVYQTQQEDLKLDLAEYSSAGLFLLGLGLGLVYLEKWRTSRSWETEEENELSENFG